MTLTERARVAGQARQASMSPAERTQAARVAGSSAHRPAVLAQRIVRTWPALDGDQRDELRRILAEAEGLMP